MKLRKLVTNDWGHLSPGLVSGSGEFQLLLPLLSFQRHFMSCIDVCLAKMRRDSGVKWKQRWESVGTAK